MVALICPAWETGMLLLYGVPPTETVPDRFVDAPSALVTHRLAASTARPTTTTRLPTTGIRPRMCPLVFWNLRPLYPRFAPRVEFELTIALDVLRRGRLCGCQAPGGAPRPAWSEGKRTWAV